MAQKFYTTNYVAVNYRQPRGFSYWTFAEVERVSGEIVDFPELFITSPYMSYAAACKWAKIQRPEWHGFEVQP